MTVRDALHDGKMLVIHSYDRKQDRKRKAGEFVEGNKANKYGATSTETRQEATNPAQKTLNKYFNIPSSMNTFNNSENSAISFREKVSDLEQKTEQNQTVKKGLSLVFPTEKYLCSPMMKFPTNHPG